MPRFTLAALALALAAVPALSQTTHSCVAKGDADTVAKALGAMCPDGTALHDSRRASRADHGFELSCKRQAARGMIPVRHGPSIWYRKDGKTIERAGRFEDHTKLGRWYRFDEEGRLESIEDLRDDWSNYGFRVECQPDGQVQAIQYYDKNGQQQGLGLRWKKDGSLVGFENLNGKSGAVRYDLKIDRPDWCRIEKCDLFAAPNRPIKGDQDPTGGMKVDQTVQLTRAPKKSHIARQ